MRFGGQNQISVTKEKKPIPAGYQYRYSGETHCSLNESFCQIWMFIPRLKSSTEEGLRVHSRTESERSSNPVTVTQAEAINTAMIGHQISLLSQQIIAVSVVCSRGRRGDLTKKINFIAQKRATRPRYHASWFFWAPRPVLGQTCNFWNSHPAAYFFLCQLLAAGSACGPARPDHSVACGGQDWPAFCVKCSSQKNNKSAVGKYIVSVVIWTG